jgi:hypothetical protein
VNSAIEVDELVVVDPGGGRVPHSQGTPTPGFTLRVYAHLFPASEDRARRDLDPAFRAVPADSLRTGEVSSGRIRRSDAVSD